MRIVNPATGETLAEVPEAGPAAIAAAFRRAPRGSRAGPPSRSPSGAR